MAQTREELRRIYGCHLVRSSWRQSWWKMECQSVSPGLNRRPRIWWEEWNIVRNIPEPPRSVLVFTLRLPLRLLSHFHPDASLSSLCPPSNWFAPFYLFSAAGSYSKKKNKKKKQGEVRKWEGQGGWDDITQSCCLLKISAQWEWK